VATSGRSSTLDDTFSPGEPAVAEARRRAEVFASTWGKAYPGAVACVTDGFDELAAHLRYPRAHWGRGPSHKLDIG
jgi:transposase-like protein